MKYGNVDSVLIWDSKGSPPMGYCANVLWRGFVTSKSANSISIPALVEENAEVFRSRYLAWIYELGDLRIKDRRLIDHLEIRPGVSYWWMTLLAEKCNYAKSPQITDVIRLFAFDDWAKHSPTIKSVMLVSSNQELQKFLRKWCKTKNIRFESQRLQTRGEPKTILKQVFERLPHVAQAGAWLLKYLIYRWPLRGIGVEEWRKSRSKVTFVSYFFNLQSTAVRSGRFGSEYWTKLPNVLNKTKIRSSWLHLYVKGPTAPTAKSAADFLQIFNGKNDGQQTHVFLDSFLSIKIVSSAIWDYLRVRRAAPKNFFTISQLELKENESVESLLWPLFKKDWKRSFFGIEAIQNLLILNLFEKAFADLPQQSSGVYLQENQGWEFGMSQAWHSSLHGRLIGFPHSTVRFRDLCYFFDQRSFCKNQADLPMPNFVAVSGDSVKDAYLKGGYPAEELIGVEALRYLYLDQLYNKQLVSQFHSEKPPKVLILGDYLPANTLLLMKLLQEIVDDLPNIELTVKPHPACPIVVADYSELELKLSDQSLSNSIDNFDIAYTSNVTSSAVDAYSAGLKVISVLNPADLNISPLRGVAGVRFVSSPDELLEALNEALFYDVQKYKKLNYFYVDSSLPRWRALLSNILIP